MEAWILVTVVVLVSVFIGRYIVTDTTDFTRKLDELQASDLLDVSPDGEITLDTFRVQRVFAEGFQHHKLILICEDHHGYWSLHYNEHGILVETIYVRFRNADKPGTHEGPTLPLREAALGDRRETPSTGSADSETTRGS